MHVLGDGAHFCELTLLVWFMQTTYLGTGTHMEDGKFAYGFFALYIYIKLSFYLHMIHDGDFCFNYGL